MLCQVCKQREATIHLTEITNGVRNEMHICQICAAEQGIAVKSQMPINELLSNLLSSQPSESELIDPAEKKLSCPECGFELDDFGKKALMGCPGDYELFKKTLMPLITKAHDGNDCHCGKKPTKVPAEDKNRIKLTEMNKQLAEAVKTENYELAARLRDKITELEK